MKKKVDKTPRYKVKQALRQLWLRSRERSTALKSASYTCTVCGKKASSAKGKEVKIEVHHKSGIVWEYLMNEVFKVLLVPPEELEVLCKECHKKITSQLSQDAPQSIKGE